MTTKNIPNKPGDALEQFDGYPLSAVREGNRITIYTHNAVKPDATFYATTDTDEKALTIVNKVNFFDDVWEAAYALLITFKVGDDLIKKDGVPSWVSNAQCKTALHQLELALARSKGETPL